MINIITELIAKIATTAKKKQKTIKSPPFQQASDVPGTFPEGSVKILTPGTARGPLGDS